MVRLKVNALRCASPFPSNGRGCVFLALDFRLIAEKRVLGPDIGTLGLLNSFPILHLRKAVLDFVARVLLSLEPQ